MWWTVNTKVVFLIQKWLIAMEVDGDSWQILPTWSTVQMLKLPLWGGFFLTHQSNPMINLIVLLVEIPYQRPTR